MENIQDALIFLNYEQWSQENWPQPYSQTHIINGNFMIFYKEPEHDNQ